MATSKKQKKLRIEINLQKEESKAIRQLLCKEGETRKECIERIILNSIVKALHKQQSLIS